MNRPDLGSKAFWEWLDAEPAKLAALIGRVDVVNLDKTLQEHPALSAWVGAAHEAARVEEERAKWELTRARAIALLAAKADPDPASGKAKTVDVLRAEADLNDAVGAAQDALFSAQQRRGALRAMADAMQDRREMLVQISAKQRREAEGYR